MSDQRPLDLRFSVQSNNRSTPDEETNEDNRDDTHLLSVRREVNVIVGDSATAGRGVHLANDVPVVQQPTVSTGIEQLFANSKRPQTRGFLSALMEPKPSKKKCATKKRARRPAVSQLENRVKTPQTASNCQPHRSKIQGSARAGNRDAASGAVLGIDEFSAMQRSLQRANPKATSTIVSGDVAAMAHQVASSEINSVSCAPSATRDAVNPLQGRDPEGMRDAVIPLRERGAAVPRYGVIPLREQEAAATRDAVISLHDLDAAVSRPIFSGGLHQIQESSRRVSRAVGIKQELDIGRDEPLTRNRATSFAWNFGRAENIEGNVQWVKKNSTGKLQVYVIVRMLMA
ncbi:hypothetical protein TKK_0001656 [Trichogramma kaykai]